jgi:hypothetical protein
MNYSQFNSLSCYEEFEIQCALTGISKIDVLKEIGHQINNYYFFISDDGIFNWYDLNGNHVENSDVLKELKEEHIPLSISKCIIPNIVISICTNTFLGCNSLKEVFIPNGVENIGEWAFGACKSLETITIPAANVTYIGYNVFKYCKSLKEVIFKGKTLDEIERMKNYPFGIKDESIIKCEI